MPRDDAIIFSDLIGKLDVLRVSCEDCGRDGCYGLNRLIKKFMGATLSWSIGSTSSPQIVRRKLRGHE